MELKCSLSGQISFMLLPVVFPGPKQRCSGRGPASGGAKCVHGSVCVFVRVCVRASARVSVGVLRSKQLQQKPFGNRISSCQSPHLALVIVGGGEGRSKKCVSARARARSWVVGPGWQFPPDAHQDSSRIFAKALPSLLPVGERNL